MKNLQASTSPRRLARPLHDWLSLGEELLWVYDSPVPPGKGNHTETRHRQLSAWLVRRGSASIAADGQQASAHAGQWIVCQAREVVQKVSDDAHLLALRCVMGWPNGTPLFAGGPLHVLDAASHPGLERRALPLVKLVGKALWNNPAQYLWKRALSYRDYVKYQTCFHHWTHALFDALETQGIFLQSPGETDPRLLECCRIIDTTSPAAGFPQKQVVRATALTIGQLNRLSVREHQCTLTAYYEQRRIQQARTALQDSARTVKEIAYEHGFAELSNFSAWFKKHTGMSPREFRSKQEKKR